MKYIVLFIFAIMCLSTCQSQTNKPPRTPLDESKITNQLSQEAYRIMVRGGTERAWTSELNDEKREGVYVSAATGDTLFVSKAKFNSGTGWPSFHYGTDKVGLGPAEQGGYEVIERQGGLHLGHVFYGEGFEGGSSRYCINGAALKFIPNN